MTTMLQQRPKMQVRDDKDPFTESHNGGTPSALTLVGDGLSEAWKAVRLGGGKLRGCPRCRGDMFLEKDQYGWYEECLQCSHRRKLSTELTGSLSEV